MQAHAHTYTELNYGPELLNASSKNIQVSFKIIAVHLKQYFSKQGTVVIRDICITPVLPVTCIRLLDT